MAAVEKRENDSGEELQKRGETRGRRRAWLNIERSIELRS